ncbi:PAS domain-containing hybrid sensor histidine kinase/response regulator [Pontibacter sp. CAU 1760]
MQVQDDDLNEGGLSALIAESAEDLYEHAPCGYMSALPDGTIVKINATLLNWLGFRPEEVLRKQKLQDLFPIGGKMYYETHFGPLLQMQGYVNEVNFDLRCKNGKLLPVLLNSRMLKDATGEPLLFRTTFFDITDRKVYEQELLRAKREAEAASKVKAEFLSTVSHEIRTPLNAIVSIANLLKGTRYTPEQKEFISTLKLSADNLLHLINDILDYSKIESGRVELAERDMNLKELVDSLLYGLSVTAEEKGLSLKAEIDKRLPAQLIGDPIKISQVLTNLLSNAIKFTSEGTVILKVRVLKSTPEDVLLAFQVVDTGIGIPEDKLEKIFQEFTQADYDINLKYGGTGLGLSISQKLLQLYGSKLTVESVHGKGTTFSFHLQLKIGEESTVEEKRQAIDPYAVQDISGVYLLLVEDNPVNVMVISKYFEKWGVTFDVATNGFEAIDLALQHDYALVLMDLQMPEMDGYTASAVIRKQPDSKYKHLPIIALSASAQYDFRERMQEAGMNDFVNKPFDPEELRNKIAYYAQSTAEWKAKVVEQPRRDSSSGKVPAILQKGEYFTLVNFEHLLEGDENDLEQLVRMNITGLDYAKRQLHNALLVQDLKEYRTSSHKINSSLEMMCANSLRAAIDFGRELLENNSQNMVLIRETSMRLTREFNYVINGLKEMLEKRWNSTYSSSNL